MRTAATFPSRALLPALLPVWVGLAYALGGLLVAELLNGIELGPTFFPGAGLTLATLVLIRRRRWAAVLACVAVAEVAVDLAQGLTPAQSVGFAVANTAEPLVGALLLRRFVGRVDLARRRHLVAFFACGVLAGPVVGGLVALVNTELNGGAPQEPLPFVLRFVLGDGLGVLAVGSAILAWRSAPLPGRSRSRTLGVLLALGALASTALIFWANVYPLAYVPAVLLVWVAFERGSREVALVGAAMAVLVGFAVAQGRHFWSAFEVEIDTGWLYVQVLLAVVIGVALLLAVEVRERELSVLERNRSVALLALQRAVTAIAAARTTDEVLTAVVEDGVAAAGAAAGGLVVHDGDGMRLIGGAGLAEWVRRGWTTFPAHPSIPIADAVLSGTPVLLRDLDDVARRYPAAVDSLTRSRGAAWAAVPFPTTSPTPGGMFYHFAVPQAFGDDQVAVLSTLAETAGQAMARAAAHEREQAARRRAELLATVSAGLDRTESAAARMQALADLVVPAFADRAHLYTADDVDLPAPVARVLDSGVGELVPGAGTPDPAATPSCSQLVVPLTARSGVIAALLAARSDERPFDADDLALALEIADRAALAIDNARLYEREHQLAVDLQTSMLPAGTVSTPQVQVAVRYRTADTHLQVGGDWYDTLRLPGGRIGLAIGDVVGHSLEAATAMGQLRSAAAALALTVAGPAQLLDRLEAFAERIPAAGLCTLSYLELDPATGILRHASAGHPPPVVQRPDGSTLLLEDGRSLPLGTLAATHPSYPSQRPEGVLTLEPGTRLVLYTDGLVERRGESIGDGLDRLTAAIARHARLDPEPLCDALMADLLTTEPRRDDVALVCVAYRPDEGLVAAPLK